MPASQPAAAVTAAVACASYRIASHAHTLDRCRCFCGIRHYKTMTKWNRAGALELTLCVAAVTSGNNGRWRPAATSRAHAHLGLATLNTQNMDDDSNRATTAPSTTAATTYHISHLQYHYLNNTHITYRLYIFHIHMSVESPAIENVERTRTRPEIGMLPSVTTPLCCRRGSIPIAGVPLGRQLYRLINIFLTSVTTPLHAHTYQPIPMRSHITAPTHTHMHCVCDTFTGNNNNTVRKHFDFERSYAAHACSSV